MAEDRGTRLGKVSLFETVILNTITDGLGAATRNLSRSVSRFEILEHDPEKWVPVFGTNHAQTKSWSLALIPPRLIRL
jgi:hypothetical protein